MAKSFKKIIAPRIALETEDPASKELVRQCNEALNHMAQRCNKAIETLTNGLNANIPIWAAGQVIEIAGGEYAHNQDFWVRHGLGVVPSYYVVLNARPSGNTSKGGVSWDTSTEGLLLRSGTAWTSTHVCFQINTRSQGFNYNFKVLLLP